MSKNTLATLIAVTVLAVSIGCQSRKTETPAPAANAADTLQSADSVPDTADASKLTYTADIKPVLDQRCDGCHAWMKSHHTLLAQKSAEPETKGLAIVYPAKPDSSVIVWRVEGQLPSGKKIDRMPKGKAPLSAEEIGKIRSWIEQGAADDAGM